MTSPSIAENNLDDLYALVGLFQRHAGKHNTQCLKAQLLCLISTCWFAVSTPWFVHPAKVRCRRGLCRPDCFRSDGVTRTETETPLRDASRSASRPVHGHTQSLRVNTSVYVGTHSL